MEICDKCSMYLPISIDDVMKLPSGFFVIHQSLLFYMETDMETEEYMH